MLKLVSKGIRTVSVRLRTQGARTTALWAYARGIPKVTGVPLLEYSRVTESLYVGPQQRANGSRTLLRAGITHIVNLRIEFDDASHGLALGDEPPFGYCYLPTIDDEAVSPSHIIEGIGFISKAIESGGKVYIHCSAGVGRAPTMAAAYLISEGYSTEEALDLIRRTRPFIKPTPKQLQGLKRFEWRDREGLTAE